MKGRDYVTAVHHVIKALSALAHALGRGEKMLKQSIHIWHWCLSLCQIAMLLQKDGDCDAWTESSPHCASLPGAPIYRTEREATADMIPTSACQITSSLSYSILNGSWHT